MTRLLAAATALAASAGAALAHEGHIAPRDGHAHPEYLALGLAALAVAGVVWFVVRRSR
jgi:glycine/D-amino acid oxidase-like deaminating enzyme